MAQAASRPDFKVAVIGAGVIGLSVAAQLQDKMGNNVDVTVIADKFSPSTTSDKAGGLFGPSDFTNTEAKDERVQTWTRSTLNHLNKLYSSRDAATVGLCLLMGYECQFQDSPLPWWKDLVYNFRQISPKSAEAQLLHVPPHCVTLWAYSTYMVSCRTYLPWLAQKIKSRGGTFEHRRVSSLTEPGLCSYDLVVNCTGLGARLLAGDKDIVPLRGQAVVVDAPWVKHFVVNITEEDSELGYIFPRANDVLLGGTAELDNWSEIPDPETTQRIHRQCSTLIPGLKSAPIVGVWAGLRPLRPQVRLEIERPSSTLLCVHLIFLLLLLRLFCLLPTTCDPLLRPRWSRDSAKLGLCSRSGTNGEGVYPGVETQVSSLNA